MSLNLNKFFVKKWITMRMAAQEFGFKQPFEIADEYPIMKNIIVFSLVPIELIFLFTYARIYGSLSRYNLQIILIVALVNIIIANLIINPIKNSPFIDETISNYEQLDYDKRKALYSFKSNAGLTVLLLLPWLIFAISITIVCFAIPR